VKFLTGGKAREQALKVLMPADLVKFQGRWCHADAVCVGESPEGKRLKLMRPRIIFGLFFYRSL